MSDKDESRIPLYAAQPATVVPENCVTAEHRRVIEMLLNVCGAAFELADDSCQQDVDGEDCHVVPDDAFQKLSDALDEIENTLPTEDIDRPDVFLAWSAMPRAALKSLLHAQPAPVVPELRVDWQENEFSAGWNACRAAMLHAGNSPAQSDCCPAQNHVSPEQNGDAPAQSQGWIQVSERMPENDGAYLCWDNRYVTTYAFIFGTWQANQCVAKNITHWMPLPAAPQEVKGE